MSPFSDIDRAVAEIAAGRMVVVVDDEDRENEGDLVMAADLVTPEAINFMATHARGLICVALAEERLAELALAPMVADNTAVHDTAFTVSVDIKGEGRTGISAFDRAATIQALCDPATAPDDLARPGHVFPLAARPGGVLRRAGHTEASVDLATMAGRTGAGVLVEVMSADGTMARRPELERFAKRHGLVMISVAQLIAYRRVTAGRIARTAVAKLPTAAGDGDIKVYASLADGREIVACITGEVAGDEPVLTRIHSECLTGDVLGSTRCDCGDQLREAQARIAAEGRGVLLYVRGDEGRGIGLTHKVRAYRLQDKGYDTVDANVALGFGADLRRYGFAAEVLHDLGIGAVRLMTNNPDKCAGLQEGGIRVAERVALGSHATADNLRYLSTKRDRMGHLIEPFAPAVAGEGVTR